MEMDGGVVEINPIGLEDIYKVKDLHDKVIKEMWGGVIDMFKYVPDVQATKVNHWGDTALHIAIDTSSDDSDKIVEQLVNAVKTTAHASASHPLSVKNYAGNTPLHAAAACGSLAKCRFIINCQNSLIKERNKDGETPLFLAAINGQKEAFCYLFDVADEQDKLSCCRRNDGDTILHCTIQREYFDMSLLILDRCKEISYVINEKGESPLETLASIPSAFKSGIQLDWWEKLVFDLFIYVGKFMNKNTTVRQESTDQNIEDPETHERTMTKRKAKAHETDAAVSRFLPRVLEKTKRYELGLKIMKRLLDEDTWYDAWIDTVIRDVNDSTILPFVLTTSNSSDPIFSDIRQSKCHGRSALLTATKHGAVEVVVEILRRKPYAIDDESWDKKNIVLVAVEARQTLILKLLRRHVSWSEKRLKHAKDLHGNTALHLAAKRSVSSNMADVSIIQLQLEVFWFEYVKELMPHNFMNIRNKVGKTPAMVFEEEHDGMLERSDKWVKDMSGNYIVAATLISGVTFSTSYQIPGSYNSTDGTPVVKPSTPAFRMFSISALVSFCFSITSLAVFLSIYSSRIEYKQYRRKLPLKLCLGLFTLFISIVSMLLSFCAAHVFELNPHHKSKCVPFYVAVALIPVAFYSATQADQLYWDIFRASLSSEPPPRPFYLEPEKQQPEQDEQVAEERREEEEVEEEPLTDQKTRRKRHRKITRWRKAGL